MGYFEDIETELGKTGTSVQQGDMDSLMTVDMVSGTISAWTDITNLLTLPADFEDLSIAITDGSTISVYGFDAENTLVILHDDGASSYLVVCYKYASSGDYTSAKTDRPPDTSIRV